MFEISDILREWVKEGGENYIHNMSYTYKRGILTIYMPRPGYLVGLQGRLVEKYNHILKNNVKGFKKVEFVQTQEL